MTLTIYGSPRSRTLRVLWTAAELGLDYVHVPLAFDDPRLKAADFLKLNPAGAVPTIVDNGFALSESLAINLYLAKTYGAGGLYPATAEGEAQALKWTLWAQGHLEPWVQQDALLAALRAAMGEASRAVIEHALGLLDRTLDDRDWLVGDRFGIADLNVACVLSPSRVARLDLSPFGCVHDWLARCYGRPAAVATRTRFA
jgi:glutathione S-transferase